jgi:hypothetical protein
LEFLASCYGGGSSAGSTIAQQQAGESSVGTRGGTWVVMAYDAIASQVYPNNTPSKYVSRIKANWNTKNNSQIK